MVIEIGRIVNEVEVKVVTVNEQERKVLNNRLAVRINKDHTTFLDFTAWGPTAEFIGAHFTKGDGIYLTGKLMNKTVQKENVEFQTTYVLVEEANFTPGRKKEQE
jgi:single-stranded DNA-binding protein